MTKRGAEIEVDTSIGDVFGYAERYYEETGYKENPRLVMLRGLVRHHSITPALSRGSHSSGDFESSISSLKYPQLIVGGNRISVVAFNMDMLRHAHREAITHQREKVYPVDLMVAFLISQPKPTDRVFKGMALDRLAIIEELRKG